VQAFHKNNVSDIDPQPLNALLMPPLKTKTLLIKQALTERMTDYNLHIFASYTTLLNLLCSEVHQIKRSTTDTRGQPEFFVKEALNTVF
jgi:hypothetical protein